MICQAPQSRPLSPSGVVVAMKTFLDHFLRAGENVFLFVLAAVVLFVIFCVLNWALFPPMFGP